MRRTSSNRAGKTHHHWPLQVTANADRYTSSDPYWNRWGSGYFYELQAAFDAYDNRLAHVLNYKGKSSGKVWKEYSEAIMGFDLQNEPMSTKTAECLGTNPPGAAWPCGRAQYMRSVLGADNPIKIITGGIGGDIVHGCTFMSTAVQCPEIDIVAIHRYAGNEAENGGDEWCASVPSYLSHANGKLVFVEEWGVKQYDDAANIVTEYPAQAYDLDKCGIPWLYWEIVPAETCPYNVQSDSIDSFSIFMGSDVDIADPIKKAATTTARQNWTGIVW
jgi:mannan endo-1,4-beta-mannosidase